MARKLEYGTRVKILERPGSMKEFVGKTGRVIGTEKYGELFYRVLLDSPVYLETTRDNGDVHSDRVTSDLWTREHLRKV